MMYCTVHHTGQIQFIFDHYKDFYGPETDEPAVRGECSTVMIIKIPWIPGIIQCYLKR